MLRLQDILERVQSYRPDADIDLIKKAYVYSAKVHQGQVRKSGEPYLIHPLEVAGLLAEMKLDEHTVCAGILHDTIEDTLATPEELGELFGPEVAGIVEGVTKLSHIPYQNSHEKAAENFRRMVVAMAKDIRVILVKLADRLHNMRTLEHMKQEKQEKIAQETLDIYAPLANRLGIQWMKADLQDLCLKYLHPKDEEELRSKLKDTSKARQEYIDHVLELLEAKMAENQLPCEISGRVKHVYSIWRKIRTQSIEFDDVPDIVAFRIITESKERCYAALGYCHESWRPVPGRIKDYIAIPKPNGYQSLHTTVIGPEGQRIEIQIRTKEMHEIAENGIAAHWKYKEGQPIGRRPEEQFAWLKKLVDWQRELDDPTEFMTSVKFDLFGDDVYVFTPRGEVKELPAGSTPIDFAYAIHSQVGHRCAGAKVNGRIVPLRYRLKNGDTVEIITTATQQPNKDWLNVVKSARAKNRINAFIRQEQRKRAIEMGREILDRELKRYGHALPKLEKSGAFAELLEQSKQYPRLEDVYAGIGYGKSTAAAIAKRVLPKEAIDQGPKEESEAPKSRLGQLFRAVAKRSTSGIMVQGLDEVLVHFAKCCNAVPGDPIVGFVTRGRGVTVHNMQCPKAMHLDPARKVSVGWDTKSSVARSVELRVITDDRPGMLATISQTFTGAGVNILNANCRVRKNHKAVNTFVVTIKDTGQLRTVMKNIEALAGIHSVERVQA